MFVLFNGANDEKDIGVVLLFSNAVSPLQLGFGTASWCKCRNSKLTCPICCLGVQKKLVAF